MERRCEKGIGLTSQAVGSVTRVRYRERQVLRAADLQAEQDYLITARRRHNIGHHGWGIVTGLRIATQAAGLVVEPGMAVDGYGRELIVDTPIKLPNNVFDALRSDSLDVWLFYDLTEFSVTHPGRSACGPQQFTRRRELSRLRLSPARGSNPRIPVEVPETDIPFSPHRTTPDDPAREWPIYLGTITRGADPDYDSRPLATLTGESVIAPSGRAKLQVDGELETDTRRFAVSISDSAGKFVERLAVDRQGDTIVTGNSTVGPPLDANLPSSRLRLRENIPQPGAPVVSPEPLCGPPPGSGISTTPGAARMIHFLPLKDTPAAAAPWQIYRTALKEEERTIQQLRFEIGHPGDKGDPTLFQLTVGTRDANGVFRPCFTVRADCTVIIEGGLTVRGRILEGPIQADPTDPRFAEEVSRQWTTGRAVGEAQTGQLFGGVNTGELQVQIRLKQTAGPPIALPNSITATETLNYAFTVTNTGNVPITNVQLYSSVTFNGNTSRDRIPIIPITVRPGQAVVVDPGAPFDPGGRIGVVDISVTGIGVSSQPRVVGAADNASIRVDPVPA